MLVIRWDTDNPEVKDVNLQLRSEVLLTQQNLNKRVDHKFVTPEDSLDIRSWRPLPSASYHIRKVYQNFLTIIKLAIQKDEKFIEEQIEDLEAGRGDSD